jgi:hypothetical protein
MKHTYSALAALTLAGMVAAAPAFAAPRVCINYRDIVSSGSKDGKILTFTMRDGRVLRNHLLGICNDLRFFGYVWDLRGSDPKVCEGMQSLRVLQSNQVCMLGKFDPPEMAKKPGA